MSEMLKNAAVVFATSVSCTGVGYAIESPKYKEQYEQCGALSSPASETCTDNVEREEGRSLTPYIGVGGASGFILALYFGEGRRLKRRNEL